MSRIINNPEMRQRLRWFFYLEALALLGFVGSMVLMAMGPRIAGYSSFVIYGKSMQPAILKGSVAVGRPVKVDSLRVGDVIVFKATGASTMTTHRIVALEDEGGRWVVTTKGDANAAADPRTLVLAGKGSKVVYSVPYVGYVFSYARTLWTNPILFKALVAGVGLYALWSVWSPGRSPQPKAPATA